MPAKAVDARKRLTRKNAFAAMGRSYKFTTQNARVGGVTPL
jgi:hypothetical protein